MKKARKEKLFVELKTMSLFPIFIIAGPTASGKTGFAIELSENFKKKGVCCEIINADSIQLYGDLKILSAFPSPDEMSRVPHHLFGILRPFETYSVGKWRKVAEAKIDELHRQGKVPILCGGTGFYLNAIIRGIAKIPDVPASYRKEVLERFQKIGREKFMELLLKLDPDNKLNPNNTQRILRAYEVVSFTGKPLSYWWNQGNNSKYKNIKTLIQLPPKEKLRENILKRAVQMVNNGAMEEVQAFLSRYPNYNGPLDRVIGFTELREFLSKKISLEELIDRMVIRTRQYAKRQSTWFKNQIPDAKFVEGGPDMIREFSDFYLSIDNKL
ncbi:MAG: tRNA (adenosine(37)-N6)-dimethylallyltransferase MiaA [Alphaproteobacteria bacterium]|nr:tRNA (adenosine(37)-N6)-dimethylallyltransferase MiaA [Alphaproteobacteria bacterium]